MSKIIEGLYYTTTHEWVKVEDGFGFIGITDYAQDSLGEIVFVELPEEEDSVEKFTQLIHNEIVMDFAPVIAEEIKINRLLSYDIKAWCETNIKLVSDVFKFPLIKDLPRSKRLEISDFLFEKFGV